MANHDKIFHGDLELAERPSFLNTCYILDTLEAAANAMANYGATARSQSIMGEMLIAARVSKADAFVVYERQQRENASGKVEEASKPTRTPRVTPAEMRLTPAEIAAKVGVK